jgi:hypothetical protein
MRNNSPRLRRPASHSGNARTDEFRRGRCSDPPRAIADKGGDSGTMLRGGARSILWDVKRPRKRRVLVDTNVWSYLVNYNAVAALHVHARCSGAVIQVAPSVVYEILRTTNVVVRDVMIEAVTRSYWRRLMPEIYEECCEFVSEVRRLRPEWLRRSPDVGSWLTAVLDWAREDEGFWSRTRHDPSRQADLIGAVGDQSALEHARTGAYLMREYARREGMPFDKVRFDGTMQFPGPVDGWDGSAVEPWRVKGQAIFRRALLWQRQDPTYVDWVGPFADIAAMRAHDASWWRFWLHDVDKRRMPRCWLRWAFETTQATRSITDGTPCDTQLGTYLVSCEHFLTADRVLVDVIEKVRPASPVPVGRTWLVAAGDRALNDVQRILNDIARRT